MDHTRDDDRGDQGRGHVTHLGRRDWIKLAAGLVATAGSGPKLLAQAGQAPAPPVRTRAGDVYTANREGHNGQMDETTQRIVRFVSEFSESNLSQADIDVLNKIMLD